MFLGSRSRSLWVFLEKHCHCSSAYTYQWIFGWVCPGGRVSSQVNILVNLFAKLYVTFILQWIAFIFGRNEEEDQ